mmetsp:Transcript_6316/g.15929  ORF Transcript_6316/g.15929 Transcript_6316/m.15929 type:complete len:215 (+) Transcript_6316:1227-1871(+)
MCVFCPFALPTLRIGRLGARSRLFPKLLRRLARTLSPHLLRANGRRPRAFPRAAEVLPFVSLARARACVAVHLLAVLLVRRAAVAERLAVAPHILPRRAARARLGERRTPRRPRLEVRLRRPLIASARPLEVAELVPRGERGGGLRAPRRRRQLLRRLERVACLVEDLHFVHNAAVLHHRLVARLEGWRLPRRGGGRRGAGSHPGAEGRGGSLA